MQFLILIKQACKQAQSYSSSKLQPGLVLIYILCHTHILSTKRSTLDQIWFCCCFLVCSKCLRLFETFTIFWPNFPGRRDLDIQSELFESRRVADIWHIWILHPVEPTLPDHPCKIVHKSTFWLLLRKFGFNQWYHASLSCRSSILLFNNLIIVKIEITKCAVPLSANHWLSHVLAIKSVLATDGTETLFSRSVFQKINIAGHTIKAISLH